MAVVASHVCFVTETYPPEINGVASTLAQLASGMRARGHRVSLVRPTQPAVDAPGRGREPRTLLVGGMRLPGYKGLRIGFPAGRALRAVWSRSRPDAVYVATEGPLGWSAVRAGGSTGRIRARPGSSRHNPRFCLMQPVEIKPGLPLNRGGCSEIEDRSRAFLDRA